MKIIDSHQHFWKYHAAEFDWISEQMQILRSDFLPDTLAELYKQNLVNGCVAVQARSSLEETHWLISLAEQYPFIKAVVGWVDLCSAQLSDELYRLSQHRRLKGFRHILQAEPAGFMQQPAFLNGIARLAAYHFSYDLLLYPHQLPEALQLVRQFPQQKFVIDHLAKPLIKNEEIQDWKNSLEQIALLPNVYCKISGMATEAHWQQWQVAQLIPYLDVVTACFGTNRLMWGSDWPVCLCATSFERWLHTVQQYFSNHPLQQQEKIFALNAIQFYNL